MLFQEPVLRILSSHRTPTPDDARAPSVPGVELWTDPHGRTYAWSYVRKRRYVVEWPGVGSFRFRIGSSVVEAEATGTAPRAALREAYDRTVLPLIIQAGGTQMLHASSVSTDRGVAAFCAPAMTGKSTLAWEMNRRGYRVWGDDSCSFVARPSGVWTQRTGATLRLREDVLPHFGLSPNGDDGHTIAVSRHETPETDRLIAVFILERRRSTHSGGAVELARLPASAAFRELLGHAYCHSLHDKDSRRGLLSAYLALSGAVPVYSLSYPSHLQSLERTATVLERAFDEIPGPQQQPGASSSTPGSSSPPVEGVATS